MPLLYDVFGVTNTRIRNRKKYLENHIPVSLNGNGTDDSSVIVKISFLLPPKWHLFNSEDFPSGVILYENTFRHSYILQHLHRHTFAHAMTAEQPLHLQNVVLITMSGLWWPRHWICIAFLSLWRKYISGKRVLGQLLEKSWGRHQMETFSALLDICAGKSPASGDFPARGQWRGALMFPLICVF